MNRRGIPSVFVLAALCVSCARNTGDAPAVPPPAPADLTVPASARADDEFDDFGDDDEEFEDEGGFGSPPTGDPEAVEKPSAGMKAVADTITKHIHGKTRAWDRLAYMADTFGHRLSGSRTLEQAIDWTLKTMKDDGLDNVRREKVMVPHWVRGQESLSVLTPTKRDLTVLGLGMSVGTKGTLRAELVVVDHIDDVGKMADGALDGKILLINQVMPPYDHDHQDAHYGGTVAARTRGAPEAAKKGAIGVLVRSVTAATLDNPHTGSLNYEDDVKKIPAAAVTGEGADFLARSAERGPVKVALKMGAKTLPDAVSGNAIGEIRGREKPEEIVVIGGHIDSWDVGDGSSDDGAGCMMAMEAAAILKDLGLRPKRTIRVVLFTNEENGLRGGKAYFEAHGQETHVGAIEADSGSGKPWGLGIAGEDRKQQRQIMAYAPLFEGLGAENIGPGWGGADISPLTRAGVLSMSVRPDASHYFDLHHSPADTIDKIDPEHLEKNAAAMALMAYILAERD
jgi:hypothetical protein